MSQKFCNILVVREAIDSFDADFVKATNYNELWDAKIAWYSPSTIPQICLYGLEQGHEINGFRPT